MKSQPRIGKIKLSSKKVVISIIEGEYQWVEEKLTSGIAGKHGDGGCSQNRFTRKRDEEEKHFLKRVREHAKKIKVQRWIFEGDKQLIKKYKRIGHAHHRTHAVRHSN